MRFKIVVIEFFIDGNVDRPSVHQRLHSFGFFSGKKCEKIGDDLIGTGILPKVFRSIRHLLVFCRL